MTETESQLAAGRRLARDLRTIRRKRGIDLKEVLDVTRLAEDVIDQLEETALIGHPVFNRVYLRLLYSAYDSVLGISSTDMIAALEEVYEADYRGSLAQKYLGEPPDEPPQDVEASSTVSSDTDAAVETRSDESEQEKSEGAIEIDTIHTTGRGNRNAAEQEKVSWLSQRVSFSQARSKLHEYLFERPKVLLPNTSGLSILIVAGLALVVFLWYAISWAVSGGIEEPAATVIEDPTATVAIPLPDPIVLPDTFSVSIIALTEALDPIRVTFDGGYRAPYWVEHLDTLVFRVSNNLKIEREVDHTKILIDGFEAPAWWLRVSGSIDLGRARTQTWLDSLTTAGISPQRAGPLE